jgi:hypothetical protein
MSPFFRTLVLASALGLVLAVAPAMAATEKFSADLTATAVVPPNASTATGKADVTYDTASKKLAWMVTYKGLSGKPTAAHFHGPAKVGANAAPVVGLTGSLDSPINGSFTLSDKQAADLEAGMWYLNVHTAKYADGEIRGQVMKATAAAATTPAPKTVKECDAEYAANKAAIEGRGQKKDDFIKACRAGTEVIPSAATPAAATAPTTTTTTTTTPSTKAPKDTKPAPAATATPTGANEFATEALAKAHCPTGVVVWVNLKSQIFHFSGYKDYGTTKDGAYMCATDATTEGARAAKDEKQP